MSELESDEDRRVLASYVAAFEAIERPSRGQSRRAWLSITRVLHRRNVRRRRAIVATAMAAAIVLVVLTEPFLHGVWPRRDGRELEQAEYGFRPGPSESRIEPAHARPVDTVDTVDTWGPAPAGVGPSVEHPAPSSPETEAVDRSAKRRTLARPPEASTLAEETALLRAIQETLVRGRPSDALPLIETYQRRFPTGSFADEVEVANIQVTCDLGDATRARASAARFVAQRPDSHLVGRVRRICRR